MAQRVKYVIQYKAQSNWHDYPGETNHNTWKSADDRRVDLIRTNQTTSKLRVVRDTSTRKVV